jgi:hypothetical protein
MYICQFVYMYMYECIYVYIYIFGSCTHTHTLSHTHTLCSPPQEHEVVATWGNRLAGGSKDNPFLQVYIDNK